MQADDERLGLMVALALPTVADAEFHLSQEDEVQREWLWSTADRAAAATMTRKQRLKIVRAFLQDAVHQHASGGPKRVFYLLHDGINVGYVDANSNCPGSLPEEINISYVSWPAHRGHGYISSGVRMLLDSLPTLMPTQGKVACLKIRPANEASLGVARSLGFAEAYRKADETDGHELIVFHLPWRKPCG